MSNVAQKAILTAKIEGVLKDLMVKTTADQVFIDGTTTLDVKLAEVISALGGKAASSHTHAQTEIVGLEDALTSRPTTETMNTAISTAISELIGGAPETYDTLKEIADYISAHADVVDAINAAIGDKADASVVTALQTTVSAIQTTVDALGALATKDTVSETDLDEALKTKINAAATGNHSHDNKTVLDGINADMVSAWNSKSKVYYSVTQPDSLADGDLWVQLVD